MNERLQLFETLSDLPPPQLSALIFALNPPRSLIPADSAAPGDRVSALLNWAETTGCGLAQVQSTLNNILPGTTQLESPLAPRQDRPVLEADDFYGREAELERLTGWLIGSKTRLIDIVALGGYGKSALAAQLCQQSAIAQRFSRHIWVNFSQVPPFRAFAPWLLGQLGRKVDQSTPAEQLSAWLVEQLSAEPVLLVLDNLETLIESSQFDVYRPWLLAWLKSGQRSVVLTTSRTTWEIPLNLQRQQYQQERLKGLTPAAAVAFLQGEGVTGSEAELVEFAHASSGHPLLMELVIGRLLYEYGDHPPMAGWPQLEPDLFVYLGNHRDDPETSVGEVFAASYRLLEAPLQTLLCHLSVYRSGFDAEMATAMADAAPEVAAVEQDLETCVRLSLLQVRPRTLETRRQYFFLPLISRFVQQQGDLTPGHQKAAEFYQSICKVPLTVNDGQAAVTPYLGWLITFARWLALTRP